MNNVVNIKTKEDDCVNRKINQCAKNLHCKYNRKRKINENLLKKKSPKQKFFSIVFDTLCGILVICSAFLCFSAINCRVQNVCPSFLGYSNLYVKTGSMIASGINPTDTVIVRSVDTDTLKAGDIIAFYVNKEDIESFNVNSCENLTEASASNTLKYKNLSFKSLLGIQSNDIKKVASSGSEMVIHHIKSVYLDTSTGIKYFKTYGSSNSSEDPWYVSEKMVVGSYVNTTGAKVISNVISSISSSYGVLITLIPAILLGLVIVFECVKDVELAKLELDCVEEKRKITDEICVKNDIGFKMDTKTKYKILAQATDENRNEYVSLLWRKGEMPKSIQKYIHKKNILLSYNQQMLELNRTCQQMFKDGEKDTKIGAFYLKNRKIIETESAKKLKLLKNLSASNDLQSSNSTQTTKSKSTSNSKLKTSTRNNPTKSKTGNTKNPKSKTSNTKNPKSKNVNTKSKKKKATE